MKKVFAFALVFLLSLSQIPAACGQAEIGEKVGAYVAQHKEQFRKELYFSALFKICLEERYIGKLPDEKAQFYGIMNGLIASTGDHYSGVVSPEEAKLMGEDKEGEFGGIGVEAVDRANYLEITRVLDGGPAQKAGMKNGDLIYEVDGVPVRTLFYIQRTARIRGEIGTVVSLKVMRPGTDRMLELKIVRGKVVAAEKHVQWKVEGGVVRANLPTFSKNTARELKAMAREIGEKYPGLPLVMDMRGNGGGLLESCQEIAALWLRPSEVLLIQKEKNATSEIFPRPDMEIVLGGQPGSVSEKSKDGGAAKKTFRGEEPLLAKRKTAVLVDGYSASATEVLAGALQDYSGELDVRIVGERTYGKSVVQSVFNVNVGEKGMAVLILTTAEWFTPKGRTIHNQGIEPDFIVKRTGEDIKAGRDAQLDRAIKWLKTGK